MSAVPLTNPEQHGDALTGKLKHTELQHSASSIPAREIVQVLTEIPCGTESGWHIHPGEEIRPDWDLSTPGLREAWAARDFSPFHGWDRRSGTPRATTRIGPVESP